MTKLRSHLKAPSRLRGENDSTSTQEGDVSSQPSPTENVTEDVYMNVNTQSAKPPTRYGTGRTKLSQFLYPRNAENYKNEDAEAGDEDACNDRTELLEIVDLDDGGYEGDAESQYPDAYEDVDNKSDKSDVSVLTLESSARHKSLTEDMERLQVEGGSSTQSASQNCHSSTERRGDTHKRTYSESFDSLSSDEVIKHIQIPTNFPTQKRMRRRSRPTEQTHGPAQHDEDEMDLG